MRARQIGNDLIKRIVSSVRIALVEPAATFTNAAVSNSGGKVKLTSAGAHGLTAAVAVGASIYVSAGTNWTVGFYSILSLDLDTTGVAITIDLTYDAGLGVPTIALANTQVSMAILALPPLQANSYLTIDHTWGFTSSANNKVVSIFLDATTMAGNTVTTSTGQRTTTTISNRNSVSSQLGSLSGTANSAYGVGVATSTTPTATVDTGSSKNLFLTAKPAAANEIMALDRYIINVWK